MKKPMHQASSGKIVSSSVVLFFSREKKPVTRTHLSPGQAPASPRRSGAGGKKTMARNPQNAKNFLCPRCGKLATVLVTLKNERHFSLDEAGNYQYHCVHCLTTFSVDKKGKVALIRLGF